MYGGKFHFAREGLGQRHSDSRGSGSSSSSRFRDSCLQDEEESSSIVRLASSAGLPPIVGYDGGFVRDARTNRFRTVGFDCSFGETPRAIGGWCGR